MHQNLWLYLLFSHLGDGRQNNILFYIKILLPPRAWCVTITPLCLCCGLYHTCIYIRIYYFYISIPIYYNMCSVIFVHCSATWWGTSKSAVVHYLCFYVYNCISIYMTYKSLLAHISTQFLSGVVFFSVYSLPNADRST